MTAPRIDSLAALVEARTGAREVLREMHGLLKDLRRERREVLDLLETGSQLLVAQAVNHYLDAHLDAHVDKMKGIIDICWEKHCQNMATMDAQQNRILQLLQANFDLLERRTAKEL
jgi:hypothetical protein